MKRFTDNTQLNTVLMLGAFLLAMPFVSNAQTSKEFDDLYFTKADRVQVKYATDDEGNKISQSQATYQSYNNNTYEPTYSAKTVNPEYIAKYKSASRESVQEQLDEQSELDSQENPNYSSEDYFVEDYDQGYSTSGATVVNIYNGGGWNWRPYNNFAFSSWNSPFWNPGWGFSIGYSFGWGGFGWNSWYGSPWGFYDPWFGPSYGFYDPWFGPSWGYGSWGRWNRWNNPYYGGWGYNSWAYNTGFHDGYYVGKKVGLNARNVVRGGRVNRSAVAGTTYASNGVSSRYRNANVQNVTGSRDASQGTRGRTVSSANSRDYSGTQNEYFQRSRMGYTSGLGTSDRNTRAVTERASSRTSARDSYSDNVRSRNSYTPAANSRSTDRTIEPSRSRTIVPGTNERSGSGSEFRGVNPANSRSSDTQRSRQVDPGNNSRTRTNNSYSAPAPSRESYTPPKRSGGNSYSAPSYRNSGSGGNSNSRSNSGFSAPSRSSSGSSYSAPSRSSSSGSSFSAPSRSSSPSYSAPSRSSGSSSGGSRSGGSSSGGSRRGGN